ncbi:MAG TPA: hypothetical protein PLE30_08145 [Candidatus Kapabacteria bacterium]|nr:hypothetical protein [Candidatus Kapabacteria bacterium]
MLIIRNIILLFLILLLYSNNGFGANIISDSTDRRYHTTIALKASVPFYLNNAEFFDINKTVFGGSTDSFKSFPELGITAKIQIDEIWRVALSLDYTEAHLGEDYYQDFTYFSRKYNRYVSQDFTTRQLPLIVNLEYNPNWRTQFRTFAGVGLGLNFNSTIWNEKVYTNPAYDKRISGTKYKSLDILGAYRIYTALDLGFDKKTLDNFLASWILQISYTGYIGSIDLYNKVKQEIDNNVIVLNERILPLNGYISLSMLVSFNFIKKQKIPKG